MTTIPDYALLIAFYVLASVGVILLTVIIGLELAC